MILNKQIDRQSGFSLVELLVAVALSGVLFLGVSMLMISLFSSNTRVRQIDRIEQTKNDLAIELTNAIRWAKIVTFETNAIILQPDSTTTNTYSFSDNRLYKNNSPITPPDVIVDNFMAQNFGASPNLPLVEISMDIADKQFSTVNSHVRFVVSQRVNTITAGP
jgi:prepilin-type N-terminal cleavage/methylation domain-containing protein